MPRSLSVMGLSSTFRLEVKQFMIINFAECFFLRKQEIEDSGHAAQPAGLREAKAKALLKKKQFWRARTCMARNPCTPAPLCCPHPPPWR